MTIYLGNFTATEHYGLYAGGGIITVNGGTFKGGPSSGNNGLHLAAGAAVIDNGDTSENKRVVNGGVYNGATTVVDSEQVKNSLLNAAINTINLKDGEYQIEFYGSNDAVKRENLTINGNTVVRF